MISFFGGRVILDPCTCKIAQASINAKHHWTLLNSPVSPLDKYWDVEDYVTVWLNPPYGKARENAGNFILKCIEEWTNDRIHEAIILVRGDSVGVKKLVKLAIWVELDHRISFLDWRGRPTQSAVPGVRLFYLGQSIARQEKFYNTFRHLGTVCRKWVP